MKSLKTYILAITGAVCANLPAANTPVPTTSEVGTGVWMENFAAATNLSIRTATPMVLVWANHLCEECEKLESAINANGFTSWMREHSEYVYCFVQGVNSDDVAPNKNSGAREFAQTAAGTHTLKSGFPFVCFYWPKSDGSVAITNFTGRSGSMLVSSTIDAGKKRSLAQQFAESIELFFDGYSQAPTTCTYEFGCGNSEGNRLEADPTTTAVFVPVKRTDGINRADTNLLVAALGAVAVTNTLIWDSGEAAKNSRLNLAAWTFAAGAKIGLSLLTADGETAAASTITYVPAKANSVTNPYWIGEKSVDTLGWADWTLDWDVATQKVAKVNAAGIKAYTLAVFSGTLWCPYCKGIEDTLFASDAFRGWIEQNHVQLVLFDQALAATDQYAGKGHLLSCDAGLEHFVGVSEHQLVSGASYLSRHGLDENSPSVRAVHDRAIQFSTQNWIAPETAAVRLSNPTILLISADGRVQGRFATWRDSDKLLGDDVRYYDPEENIARLEDLLKLADRADENDDYITTTSLSHAIGTTTAVTFQINDRQNAYQLTELATGSLTFSVTSPADKSVKIDYLIGTDIVASGFDTLTVTIKKSSLSYPQYLRLTGYTSTSTRIAGSSSVYTASMTSTLVAGTGNDEATAYRNFSGNIELKTVDVEDSAKVKLRKTSGRLPPGMSLKYDKTIKTVVLSGKPTKPGAYTFSYQISLNGATKDEITTTLTVVDPREVNPFVNVARAETIPLVAAGADGENTLAGTLAVSLAKTGKVTAKFTGDTAKKLSFAGFWRDIEDKGRVVATLAAKGGVTLELTMEANGELSANLIGLAAAYTMSGATMLSGATTFGDYASFAGRYTVTLPVESVDESALCTGSGSLLLTVTPKGVVKGNGTLPNGKAISVASRLCIDPSDTAYAFIPVIVKAGKNMLSALLRLEAEAASHYADEMTVRVIRAAAGTASYWRDSTDGAARTIRLATYGGYFVKGMTLEQWLALYELKGELVPMVGGYNDFGVANYKYNKTTGLITGKVMKMTLPSGETVAGTIKGVVMPGWIDCHCADEEFEGQYVERPFASGTVYFRKKVNGKSTTCSLPFDLTVR